MARVVVASYNVENLFARPKAFDTTDWAAGEPVLSAYHEFTRLIAQKSYSDPDRVRMRELLVALDVYAVNQRGAVRRKQTASPTWAWLRKNRGSFDREPQDATKDVEIVATGRADWIGWLELATETTDEVGTRTTARVIGDIDADVIAIVEAEDRPSLARLNAELLGGRYEHVMLVDGNDDRGIDVVREHFVAGGDEPLRDCGSHETRSDDTDSCHCTSFLNIVSGRHYVQKTTVGTTLCSEKLPSARR